MSFLETTFTKNIHPFHPLSSVLFYKKKKTFFFFSKLALHNMAAQLTVIDRKHSEMIQAWNSFRIAENNYIYFLKEHLIPHIYISNKIVVIHMLVHLFSHSSGRGNLICLISKHS